MAPPGTRRQRLTRQEFREEFRVVDELPRTPSGKVKKLVLRGLLRDEHQ